MILKDQETNSTTLQFTISFFQATTSQQHCTQRKLTIRWTMKFNKKLADVLIHHIHFKTSHHPVKQFTKSIISIIVDFEL